uniref:PiggyBac transposable element-derived protein domain-containing protein n=1 Tax=Amphimedon queenslandica TaxID=400682 RepID=A0A1X7T972_AMPQE
MSGRRFELLMSYLHLNDSKKMPDRDSSNYDKLYKIHPLLDRVVNAFRNTWTPRQNLSVDESIIAVKGRLSWVQHMPK